MSLFVKKRDGRQEEIKFDKVTARIQHFCHGLDEKYIQAPMIAQKVIAGIYPGVTTTELDELAAQTCAYQATQHPDFSVLAGRIAVSNMHKETPSTFAECVNLSYNNRHPTTGTWAPLVSEQFKKDADAIMDEVEAAIVMDRDFGYDYFGFKTLTRSYLFRIDDKIIERPQYLIMRVAIGLWGTNLPKVLETYELMSKKYFTHATPTLFNAGTTRPQLSSCFLLQMKDDSIEGIFDTLKQCAEISQYAGGIGLSISNVRAGGSYVRGTNGTSNGIVPMLRVFNDTARYVDQGGGKRKGSFAMYVEPWHADIYSFLELRKNHGDENARARDLFYALWIPDLFMKRVSANGDWTLMCPNECPGLYDTWGEEFETKYLEYEKLGKGRQTIKAQKLWFAVLESQVETGTPYMLFKDSCNRKSNQQNLGTIKSSNLCTEIVEYTSPDEVAVCNLASINLGIFVHGGRHDKDHGDNVPEVATFDFNELYRITKVVTKNLNRVIDVNFYPVKEAENSNVKHRPVGIGVQGLADCFCKLSLPFDSPEAIQLNKDIFETMYFGAVEASCELAEEEGHYESYPGCPASKGQLQFDLWNVTPSDRWDWAALKAKIATHGLRNSLLMAPMPTASTAQIMGNNEAIEPFTSNMYNRRVLAGEFAIVNKYLLRDLVDGGHWNEDNRNQMIADGGSVQGLNIPQRLKDIYKTVWEVSQKVILNMAADRGAFICQSQSLNIHLGAPTTGKLTSMHFYAWKLGLKTGMYYLRTQPKAKAIQFTVDQAKLAVNNKEVVKGEVVKMLPVVKPSALPSAPEEEEICLSCGA